MVCTAWTFLRISKCSFLGRAATSLSLKTALTLSCFHKFSQAEACRPGTMILGTSESSGVLFFENIKPFVTSGVPVPQIASLVFSSAWTFRQKSARVQSFSWFVVSTKRQVPVLSGILMALDQQKPTKSYKCVGFR